MRGSQHVRKIQLTSWQTQFKLQRTVAHVDMQPPTLQPAFPLSHLPTEFASQNLVFWVTSAVPCILGCSSTTLASKSVDDRKQAGLILKSDGTKRVCSDAIPDANKSCHITDVTLSYAINLLLKKGILYLYISSLLPVPTLMSKYPLKSYLSQSVLVVRRRVYGIFFSFWIET